MTDNGFIIIPRCIFDDPLLHNGTRFRAWLWLVSEAAWKPRRVIVTNGRTSEIVELGRGQLSHSRRYIAKAWGWSEKRVRTFLNRLEKDGMIDLKAGRHQTVISICNYDIYQGRAMMRAGKRAHKRAGKGPAKGRKKKTLKKEIITIALTRRPKILKGGRKMALYTGTRLYPRKKDRGRRRRHSPKLGRKA